MTLKCSEIFRKFESRFVQSFVCATIYAVFVLGAGTQAVSLGWSAISE